MKSNFKDWFLCKSTAPASQYFQYFDLKNTRQCFALLNAAQFYYRDIHVKQHSEARIIKDTVMKQSKGVNDDQKP